MAIKVIRNNESIVPFFSERMSFIRGLDPLGLQNTSDATYSQLLPGLNNVTGRIRYYSFYCWLLDLYSKENGSTDPKEEKKFIRRAEYIIALASLYFKGDNSSIPGSNYAKQEVMVKQNKIHDLEAGTFKPDGATRDTYWNYPLGAFGQYYLGSLRDIGIISDREKNQGVYVRTNNRSGNTVSGESLAQAFEENISNNSKMLFSECTKNGVITETQLKGLLPDFDLTVVPENSKESDLLLNLLLDKDFPLLIEETPSTLRKQTIYHLLNYVAGTKDEEIVDRSFVYYAYNNQGRFRNENDSCLFGWYYYQFNEFWHFANTSIFNGTLSFLENSAGPNWLPLPELIKQVCDGIISKLIGLDFIKDDKSLIKTLLTNISSYSEYNFYELARENSSIDRALYGFLLLSVLFNKNRNQIIELKQYAENKAIGKDGEPSGYFINQFSKKLDQTVLSFISEYIYSNIIYRHQYVAFRKMRGGIQSTQKFLLEDFHIRYLGNFEPGYTAPRVGRLLAFLVDLGILNTSHRLTPYGKVILNTQNPEND